MYTNSIVRNIMNVTIENEFNKSMKQHVYSKNDIQEKLFKYLENEDRKNNISFMEELQKSFNDSLPEEEKDNSEIEKEAENTNLDDLEDNDLDQLSEEEYSRREQILKAMYLNTLKEYYTLKEKIYKENIKDNGDISFDDNNYKKILQYDIYLRKIDTRFKGINGKYISEEFEDVNDEVNKYVDEENKYQKKLMNDHEKVLEDKEDLNESMENISEEIEMLDISDENYESKYDSLINEYMKLDAKLHLKQPSILEIHRQEENKKQQDYISGRKVGLGYQKRFERLLDDKNYTTEKAEDEKAKKMGIYYSDDKIKADEHLEDISDNHESVIASSIKAIKIKLEENDIQGAKNILENISKLLGEEITSEILNDDKVSDKDKEIIRNLSEKDNSKKSIEVSSKKDLGFMAELSKVADEEEILSEDLQDENDNIGKDSRDKKGNYHDIPSPFEPRGRKY